jgi:hypothetical protein
MLLEKDIKRLIENRQVCIATKQITVDGKKVMFMYREKPTHTIDSGWRFLSGDEDDNYMAKSQNFSYYDLNTIANYDQAIIPYIDAPEGSEFERSEDLLSFVEVEPE